MQEVLYISSKTARIVDPEVLIYHNINIKIANCALSGLLDLRQSLPQLIFIDTNLQKINGLECLRMLRSIPKYHHIKIAMIAKEKNFTDVNTAILSGADYYLSEPICSQTIIKILHDINNQGYYRQFDNILNDYSFDNEAIKIKS